MKPDVAKFPEMCPYVPVCVIKKTDTHAFLRTTRALLLNICRNAENETCSVRARKLSISDVFFFQKLLMSPISVTALLVGLRVRIRPGHGCLRLMMVVCCQLEVSVSDRSLVQRSPTECGVSECDQVQQEHSTPAIHR